MAAQALQTISWGEMNMRMEVKKTESKKIIVPVGKFHSGDFFKCTKCGYTVRMKVLGNTATCSQCGGRMERI